MKAAFKFCLFVCLTSIDFCFITGSASDRWTSLNDKVLGSFAPLEVGMLAQLLVVYAIMTALLKAMNLQPSLTSKIDDHRHFSGAGG